MNDLNRRRALQALSLPLLPGTALAQAWPDKPLKLVVGFAPGGGTDVLARLVAQHLGQRLGQAVVVDNRPGANMIVGSEAVAKAPPDGLTLGMVAVPTVTNPSLYSKLPFDTTRDFTWITQLTTSSLVLLANKSVPANTIQDVIAMAKKEPGKLAYGSSGAGGSIHLSGVLLEKMAGIQMIHVPYKGNGPAMTDLLGGRLQFMFADIPQVAAQIKEGAVKAIAVSTLRRSAAMPDVPTIAETGLAGYDVAVWYGVCGPAGLPRNVVSTLARELREVVQMPAVREQLGKWGVTPVGSSPEEFEGFIKAELAKWSGTIRSAGIKLD
ncbi:MAG TPA: tripartite tricarboxylate transporter substrate binding protein [Ramlibacter sp.]|nr:tripartite tricarboxylate transporter substrate binding protein [Ramlibacter sp.]